jgi:hypothetical protein
VGFRHNFVGYVIFVKGYLELAHNHAARGTLHDDCPQ